MIVAGKGVHGVYYERVVREQKFQARSTILPAGKNSLIAWTKQALQAANGILDSASGTPPARTDGAHEPYQSGNGCKNQVSGMVYVCM